jgi:hypothetical protein
MAEQGDAKLTELLVNPGELPEGPVRQRLRSMQGSLRGACGALATVPGSRQAGEVLRPSVRANRLAR